MESVQIVKIVIHTLSSGCRKPFTTNAVKYNGRCLSLDTWSHLRDINQQYLTCRFFRKWSLYGIADRS
jgi:hypothetical protein